MGKRITIKDLADAALCSPTSAARFLKGQPLSPVLQRTCEHFYAALGGVYIKPPGGDDFRLMAIATVASDEAAREAKRAAEKKALRDEYQAARLRARGH